MFNVHHSTFQININSTEKNRSSYKTSVIYEISNKIISLLF